MCSLEIVKDFLFNNLTPLPSLHIKPATPPLPRSLLKWNCSLLRTERGMDTFLIKNRKRGMQATVQLRTPRTEREDRSSTQNGTIKQRDENGTI